MQKIARCVVTCRNLTLTFVRSNVALFLLSTERLRPQRLAQDNSVVGLDQSFQYELS